jgi:type VI secretion system secreted protein Hcp
MKTSRWLLRFALVLFLLATADSARAAVQFFLKVDGVDGESQVKGHEKEIRVTGYDFVADDNGVLTFSVRKSLDISTISFLTALGSAQSFPNATFVGFSTGNTKTPVLKIVFEHLLVTAVHGSDATAPATGIADTVAFSFSKAVVTYNQSDAKGSGVTPHSVTITPPTPAPND